MVLDRSNSPVSTILGIAVCLVAVVGTVFFDWTWSNPDGKLLPLVVGIAAAVVGVLFVLGKRR